MSELKLIEIPPITILDLKTPANSKIFNESDIQSDPEDFKETLKTNKRFLRKRSRSQDSLLHSIKNKTIKRRRDNSSQVELKTEQDVRKYYLNINKKIKVKPVLLETIFESLDESIEEDEEVRKLGRATKRVLNICDGFNINKSLINKRKNLIRKNLGSRKKPKKIALARFMEDFKKKTESLDSSD